MINRITVTNHLNESLVVDLRNPEKSGFLFYNISGLGPVKANINIGEVANSDISVFNSAKLTTRNIVIPNMFMWDNDDGASIEDLRKKTYAYFPLKKKVKLVIESDNRIAETEGYVESNEPSIFSPQEGTVISILCPDPYLYDASSNSRNIVSFTGTIPAFEFPFSNESLTGKTIEFGVIDNETSHSFNYNGDAEVGVTIRISIHGSLNQFGVVSVYNNRTSEYFKIDCDKAYDIVDDLPDGMIEISTEKGKKYVHYITADGNSINILNSMVKGSSWIKVVRGNNNMNFTADRNVESLSVEIENRIAYEGI